MFTTITIEQTERGYRVRFPQKPCDSAICGFHQNKMVWQKQANDAANVYWTIPAERLDFAKEVIAYWYTEQDPRGERGKNRNGGNCVAVVVEVPETERMAA